MNHFELVVRKVKNHSIAHLYFDLKNEKVNKFNREVITEFEELIKSLTARASEFEALVLFSRKPGNFVAGADITLFQAAKTADEARSLSEAGHRLLNAWEDLPFPKVVAINGTCLGGGCELALASTAIVMSSDPSARIGLPETLLGVIPGMGGCVRMPWKIGLAQSLDLILSGRNLSGEKAYKAGLADALIPKENFDETVVAWVINNLEALKNATRIAKEPKLGGMGGIAGRILEGNPVGRAIIFKKARDGVMSKTKGNYPSPLEAIEVIRDTHTHYQANFRGETRAAAMKREAQGFGNMAATDISKNLIRLFFLTEGVKKANGLVGATPVETKKVAAAGVLGAGVMGGGIAHLLADKNILVQMKDLQLAGLELGIQQALGLFKKAVKRKSITQRQFDQKLARIAPTTHYDGFKNAEVVIEAVVEKMEVKQAVLRECENFVPADCVIATNTSSLSVSEMQNAMKNPSRFCGMHFFNPVHRMPLVEVIRGAQSSDHAVSQIFQFSKQIGKTPIVVKDSPGFLVNRLLMPYLAEAAVMVSEGVKIEEIDAAMLKFGMPMGPIELIDEVGLDIAEKVGHILHDAFGERMPNPNTFETLLKQKRLGKKSGSGFYVYSGPEKKEKHLDPEIYNILKLTPTAGKISEQDIVDRCVLSMVNEAARCLEEKVVENAEAVDLGMIMGTGFPPFRGGLLRYADSLGLEHVVVRLTALSVQVAKRFEPSESLKAFAKRGAFYQ
ncbi:MAG: enoyl-CoA hydratase/isomerase family protein [Bdellovibrionales bacterium]|nr:enoyl-CoA hydratase/isomerase family protein [Oligoflexia bacterium]